MPEDIVAYGADDLARLAADAFGFLAERKAGEPKIRFEVATLQSSGDLKAIGLLDIVNDDMPFLVDSVLGLLNEHGFAIPLVLHPILAVETQWRRCTMLHPNANGPAARKLDPHSIARLDDERCGEVSGRNVLARCGWRLRTGGQ